MGLISTVRDLLERRQALRELRSFQADAREDSYWTFRNAMTEALDVYERDQFGRARDIWNEASAKFPDQAIRSELAIRLLLKLRLFDPLEQLATRGAQRYPSDAKYPEALALVAYERGDMAQALSRSAALRKRHPTSDKGYWIAAAALSRLDRAAEAEAVFAEAFQHLPDDPGLRIEYAKLAERRKDWSLALERWRFLADKFGHLAGVAGAAVALARLGRYPEADALIESVRHTSGNDHLVWVSYARIAEIKADWEEAARRWAFFRKRFPRLPTGYDEGQRPLKELGRDNDIEDILREGVEQVREESKLLVQFAWVAQHRQDWSEAAQRWLLLRERFPKHPAGYIHGAEALEAMGRTEQAQELRRQQPS